VTPSAGQEFTAKPEAREKIALKAKMLESCLNEEHETVDASDKGRLAAIRSVAAEFGFHPFQDEVVRIY